MSKINDGGPAYPVDLPSGGVYSGMFLRDWFAGQALAGMLATYKPGEPWNFSENPKESFAGACYSHADAMLAEREKERGGE